MHIHGNMMNVQSANPYGAAQNERAAAAQRAAEVRKRLLNSAQSVDGEAGAEETSLIGRWLGDDEYHSSSGRDPDFG